MVYCMREANEPPISCFPKTVINTNVLNAIAAELTAWQADNKPAPDALVRIAEILHTTGRLSDRLPDFYAHRDA